MDHNSHYTNRDTGPLREPGDLSKATLFRKFDIGFGLRFSGCKTAFCFTAKFPVEGLAVVMLVMEC